MADVAETQGSAADAKAAKKEAKKAEKEAKKAEKAAFPPHGSRKELSRAEGRHGCRRGSGYRRIHNIDYRFNRASALTCRKRQICR